MKKLFSLLVAGFVFAPLVCSAAVTAYSPPVGGMTISVPVNQTRSIALPLQHYPAGGGAVIGKLSGVGVNYIEVAGANWPAASYSNASNPYYLRINSGVASGRVFMLGTTANTASRIYVVTDGVDLVASGVAVNDAYELVLADTLSSIFGGSVQGGSDYLSADNVQVWSGADWLVFYYNTPRSRWELRTDTATSPTRSNYALRPDRGVMISRRGGAELKMFISGRVPTQPAKYFHTYSGVTFLSNSLPVGITLGALAMQTRASGWIAGSSGASARNNADLIQVWSGADWLVFYYNSIRNRWELNTDTASSPSRDVYTIAAGRPIMIRRLGSTSIATEKLISLPMPY